MSEDRDDKGYVDYYAILELPEDAKPGEVRKVYKRMMKDLLLEISRAEITEERRAHFLLRMAILNAALVILRDTERRDIYWRERQELMALEEQWRQAVEQNTDTKDALRRRYDSRVRDFLSKYVEDLMLEAGRDKEAVEASNWDPAHERHAFRILRYYRQNLYQQILERLPFAEVTPPSIDWEERRSTAAAILGGGR